MDFQTTANRLARLVRLDFGVFDEIKNDVTATATGLAVVVAATLLTGIGSWLWVLINYDSDVRKLLDLEGGTVLLQSVILGGIFQVGLWVAWVAVAYFLLAQVFRARTDLNQLLRTMGYAFAPMAVSVLFFIPVLDMPIDVFALAATVALSTVAIAACTNASLGQVLVANLFGFAVFVIVLGVLGNNDLNLAPGLFLQDIEGT